MRDSFDPKTKTFKYRVFYQTNAVEIQYSIEPLSDIELIRHVILWQTIGNIDLELQIPDYVQSDMVDLLFDMVPHMLYRRQIRIAGRPLKSLNMI